MFAFIFGCISTLLVVLVLAWCCYSEKEPDEPVPPINPNELANTILRNLAAVQMLQLHLNVGSIDYHLAKDMIALQEKHHMVLIAVPVQEVEEVDKKAKDDEAWERLKLALNVAWSDDDDMSEDYVK